ncbi:hypothetical protein BpHYR1_004094 [Brachionus plicatilis]|uniref:Uncharacterized protein n=1 Tax=Brachionus plicatilis TaxID=10195 RepID=A0A3M7QR49_BRAPC|nr:hypothetical protein BpHYR1_004094 [Brachionus plicatilis]
MAKSNNDGKAFGFFYSKLINTFVTYFKFICLQGHYHLIYQYNNQLLGNHLADIQEMKKNYLIKPYPLQQLSMKQHQKQFAHSFAFLSISTNK